MCQAARKNISIHAPHEGERRFCPLRRLYPPKFQSTLPTRGSDIPSLRVIISVKRFQSTLPTRGSDIYRHAIAADECHFNPRSPRGGATVDYYTKTVPYAISIHAPHEGERLPRIPSDDAKQVFQSTLPTRGSDTASRSYSCRSAHFNPRSPRGGATETHIYPANRTLDFNPRSPRGGATPSMIGRLKNTA